MVRRVEDYPFGDLLREARIARQLHAELTVTVPPTNVRCEAMAEALAARVTELDRRASIAAECRTRRVGGRG